MIAATADTHALLWYLWNDARLSAAARQAFESAAQNGDQIAVSSISLVEIVYLVEKKRVPPNTFDTVIAFLDQPDSLLREIAIDRAIVRELSQVPRDQVADLPDRLIAATALHRRVPLITRDQRIQLTSLTTIW